MNNNKENNKENVTKNDKIIEKKRICIKGFMEKIKDIRHISTD